ncbi:hypothetical protein RI129_011314 [Pyrocoelia pectoralis]|uniref:Small ribosomal subunit protein mS31 n=1 Tax=Pyrocoelia pectoralis TaxID=417401 RepID=A0AAN7V7Q0_9COLE
MIHFRLLRCRQYTIKVLRSKFSTKRNDTTSASSSNSDSDDERKLKQKKRSEEAQQKLHLLLKDMIERDTITKPNDNNLVLTKAKDHRRVATKGEPGTESVKTETVTKDIVKAVQDVSESLGGDIKKTESELLQKLLGPSKEEAQQDLNDLFKDMQIDRETKSDVEISRAEQVRQLLHSIKSQPSVTQTSRPAVKRRQQAPLSRPEIQHEPINLHIDERLGIFNVDQVKNWKNPNLNSTWRTLQKRELELSVTHPPANYFQQMILWTKQGKIWKFPIDNEQDLETERDVYFTEHIFLEKHLEGWCPSKGPLRHFMELVCVALSKNAYLTAQMKKDHIDWFRDYFTEKKQILQEVGAFPPGFDIDKGALEIEAK